MLRIRPSGFPLLRHPVITSPIISRPLLHYPNTKFRRQILPISSSFNRQFSLFGLFQKPTTQSPGSDATQASQQPEQPTSPSIESIEHVQEAANTAPSSPIELETFPLPSVQNEVEPVVSLIEEILTPPITFLSEVFVFVHNTVPFLSWASTIVLVTVSFRLTFRTVLEYLGKRRSRQLRNVFEPMRTVLASYVENPLQSKSPRVRPHIQKLALLVSARIANHYVPKGVNYAPMWARLSQIPIFLGISEALRAMLGCNPGLLGLIFGVWTPIDPKLHSTNTLSHLHQPDMIVDNSIFDWTDLTVPDATEVLPIAFATIVGWNLYQGLRSIANRRRLIGSESSITEFGIIISIVAMMSAFSIAKGIPAGLLLFWVANGLMSVNLKILSWFGMDQMESKPTAKAVKPGQKPKDFVAPTRTLTMSKSQLMFLGDEIIPKKKSKK